MSEEFVSKKELFLYKINKEISLIEEELQEKRKRIFLNYINDCREHDSTVSMLKYNLQSCQNTYKLNREVFDDYYLYLNICAQLLSVDFSDGEYNFLLKRDNILTEILHILQTLKEDTDYYCLYNGKENVMRITTDCIKNGINKYLKENCYEEH